MLAEQVNYFRMSKDIYLFFYLDAEMEPVQMTKSLYQKEHVGIVYKFLGDK